MGRGPTGCIRLVGGPARRWPLTGCKGCVVPQTDVENTGLLTCLRDERYPGSAVLMGTEEPEPAPILPADDIRELDVPWAYKVHDAGPPCVSRGENTEPMFCEREDLSTGPLVLMMGGSHVSHWADAFADLAAERGWRLVVMERSGCHVTTDARGERGGFDFGEECRVWNEHAMPTVIDMDPDLVIAQGTTRLGGGEKPEILTIGTSEAIKRLSDAGIPVMLLRETTTLERGMRTCDRSDDEALRACTDDRSAYYSPEYDDATAEDLGFDPQLVTFFDSSQFLCTDTTCFAELGNVRVHRDDNHLTTVISRTIAPYLGIHLAEFRPEFQ